MHVTVDNKWFRTAVVLSSLPRALSSPTAPALDGLDTDGGDGEVSGKHVTRAWIAQLHRRAGPC